MLDQLPMDMNVLSEVLDYVNMGVYITDRDRRIVLWNRKAEEITGHKASDVVGYRCSDDVLNHKDKDDRLICTSDFCPLYKSILTGKDSGDPLLVYAKKPDGRRVPVLVSTAPLRDKDGNIVGGIELFQDASRQIRDLEIAQQIQTHQLPPSLPETDHIRFDVRYYPHGQVGGDFYDVFPVGKDGFGVFLADVQGHGVSAALYTMTLKTLVEKHGDIAGDPDRFMGAINQDLARFLTEGGFASAFYAVVNVAENRVAYTNAGHPPPLLFRAQDGSVEQLGGEGMLLGLLPDLAYDCSTTVLSPGDLLLCYTDGVTEVANQDEKMMGMDGLATCLSEEAREGEVGAIDRIYQRVYDYCDQVALPDDVLLLSIARRE
ncbi:MAG: SpoIIE family protein phosphatase [Planctomycetota bacterium]